MLLVIVGAGASYDSILSRKPPTSPQAELTRPPLADNLFEACPQFETVMREIPQVMPIAPFLHSRPGGQSVEDILAVFTAEAARNAQRKVQLAAVRFYLQAIISGVERSWYLDSPVPTNLMALLDQIEHARGQGEPAVFVTFNYDRLIENALTNRRWKLQGLSDYIRPRDTKLVKLHGSVDWTRPVGTYDRSQFGGNPWEVAREICNRIEHLGPPGPIQHWNSVPNSVVGPHLTIPAIAVPVKAKTSFECPDAHVEALRECLPRVSAVLTIGWRGAEVQFLTLLRDGARQELPVLCVGGSTADAEATVTQLRSVLDAPTCTPFGAGFSELIRGRAADSLLAKAWQS